MIIQVEDRTVHGGQTVFPGTQQDNQVVTLYFQGLPELSAGQAVTLSWTARDQAAGAVEALAREGDYYAYTIGADMTRYAAVDAYLRVIAGNEIWNSKTFRIQLNPLPDIESAIVSTLPNTSVIQEVLSQLSLASGRADTAASQAAQAAQEASDAASSLNAFRSYVVRADAAQVFTDGQKSTARTNIGAAAQAQAEELQSAVDRLNAIATATGSADVLLFSSRASGENKGVTFAMAPDGACQVSGVANGLAVHNFFFNAAALPAWLSPGRTYTVEYASTNVSLQIWFYKNGTYYTGNTYKSDGQFTVPQDADGCLVRLSVTSGTTVSETVRPHIWTAASNQDLQAQLVRLAASQIPYAGIWPNASSVNAISQTGVYLLTGNASAPTPYGTLLHLELSGTTKMQIMFSLTGLNIYCRRYSGGWQGWTHLDRAYKPNPYYRAKSYLAFGDSLTYGALWNTDENGQAVLTRASLGSRVPDRIANAVNCSSYANLGVGGMAYCGGTEVTPSFLNYIKSQDISGAGLITLMGGRNDGGNPLGSRDSAPGEATICGQIAAIIQYIRGVNPRCQVVIIQATPYTSLNDPFGAVYSTGGWSLDTFDAEVSALCKKHGAGYCAWYGCSLFSVWSDLSGGGNNYAHMRDNASYEQMGDFIAGQVARYYLN